jgi:hypothetical protein
VSLTTHYVFSQHASYPHHHPPKSSIYFFYRFSMANSINECNVLFEVECCDAITLVFLHSDFIFKICNAARGVSPSFLDVCVSLDHLTFIQALASKRLVLGAAVPQVVTE